MPILLLPILIVKKIIDRLLKLSEGLKLQKYLRQLRLLSVLRKKETIVNEEEQKMIATLKIDITKDPYFVKGMEMGYGNGIEQGIETGIETGIKKERYDVALNMMYKSYTDEQIVDILNFDLQQVEVIRQKYNELGDNAYKWVEEQFI